MTQGGFTISYTVPAAAPPHTTTVVPATPSPAVPAKIPLAFTGAAVLATVMLATLAIVVGAILVAATRRRQLEASMVPLRASGVERR